MIIVFQGTKNSDKKAGAAMALVASTEALKTGRKVLIISLASYTEGQNLEDFVFEKEKQSESENAIAVFSNRFSYQTTGIDAAIRKADTGMFTKKDLDSFVRGIFRNKNAFDILDTSKQQNFEQNLSNKKRQESVNKILKTAETVYDYVFVYSGNTNEDAVKNINNLSEKIVVVVNHGKRREFADTTETMVHDGRKNDAAVIIYNHEPSSIWNLKILKKEYDIENIFPFIHNYRFDDAKDSGEIPRFAATNRGSVKNGINAELMKEVWALTDFIDGNAKENIEILKEEALRHTAGIDETPALLNEISGTETESVSEKKGLFGKNRTFIATRVMMNGTRPEYKEKQEFSFDAEDNTDAENKKESSESAESTENYDDEASESSGMSEKRIREMDAFFNEDNLEEDEEYDELSEKEDKEAENNSEGQTEDTDELLMDCFD